MMRRLACRILLTGSLMLATAFGAGAEDPHFMSQKQECAPFVPGAVLPWNTDYNAARKEAMAEKRPLLLYFYMSGSEFCQKMERSTLNEPAIAKMLTKEFVLVKISCDVESKLADSLKIENCPTIVIANSTGNIAAIHSGYRDSEQFLDELQRALAKIASGK
jgi:thioredoxin-related protein